MKISDKIKELANIKDAIDIDAAAASIRGNIHFRGPNVWILAFSIVIASVGLNINSTAVIIGAMLISPLMGPILGVGLGLGVNDTGLLRDSFRNLLVMVAISLMASSLYFFLSPLKLANPTELLARTNPSFYDVLIATFGGAAGMLENSRKEKGTVLSGVAIATALMPPLCTAGYGLATLNFKYFFGAMLLFVINCVFISLSTYMMAKILGFKEVVFPSEEYAKKTRMTVTTVVILVVIPSVWSAVMMVKENTVSQKAASYVSENKILEHCYIYDYKVDTRKGDLSLYIAGSGLSEADTARLMISALHYGLDTSKVDFILQKNDRKHSLSNDELFKEIFEQSNKTISDKDAQIKDLQERLASLMKDEIPTLQVSKEMLAAFEGLKEIYISRGTLTQSDSLKQKECILVMTTGATDLTPSQKERLESWLKTRLDNEDVRLLHTVEAVK